MATCTLSEIEVQINEEAPVLWKSAIADFNQKDWGVERAIDKDQKTAWGIYPEVGKSHTAVFVLQHGQSITPNDQVSIRLHQLHGGGHLIGRLRLRLSDADPPSAIERLPEGIERILRLRKEDRSQHDRLQLAIHFDVRDYKRN